MKTKHLHRAWYPTDVDDTDPEYIGAFSGSYPYPRDDAVIVDVDWSERGQVQVTYLVDD
jgi:hypothetical protein